MTSTLLPPTSDAPGREHHPRGLGTALAGAAVWQFTAADAAAICALPDLETTVLPAGTESLAGALTPGHAFDVLALLPCDEAQALEVEALVRAAPPRLAVLVIGRYPAIFGDSYALPYDVWSEPLADQATGAFGPLLRSVHEREALTAVHAHRRITDALDGVLDLDGDLAQTVSRAMTALTEGLQCRSAAFWRPTASGTTLVRVGATGADPALDRALSGHDGAPGDPMRELAVDGTPAGETLRSGRASVTESEPGSLLLPARANGRVCGVVALSGAGALARRRTSFELAATATDRVAALVQAHLGAEQLNAVTASSPLAIVLTNAAGDVVSYNAAAERLLGVPRERALDRPVDDLLAPASRRRHAERIASLIRHAVHGTPRTAELTLHPAGAPERRLELTVSAWGRGGDRRYALIASDVSARHRAEQRVAELAYTHRETGLPNEAALMLALELPEPRRGFVAVDLCRFDHVREILGSIETTAVVRALGARLRELVGAHGRVHHLSRAEFTVLLENVDRPGLDALAERVCAGLTRPLDVDGTRLFLPCAVGASLGDGAAGLDDALRGLRIARSSGETRPCFYDTEDPPDSGRLQREADLQGAVARGEMRLHYQPIVDLAGGGIHGFEALVRWAHPKLGLLAPGMFIDLAEESGLIVEIGGWVAEEACRQLAAWRREHGFAGAVSFNVAPRQLLSGDLVGRVAEATERHRVDPDRLVAEVVESAALQDLVAARRTLADLRTLGLRIALDDFGTGESSLGRLAELPVQVLKLDRSLVDGLPSDRTSRAITHSAIHLAGELGLDVVSEGVETVAQREHLRTLPGRFAQGYLFGRPAPPAEALVPGPA